MEFYWELTLKDGDIIEIPPAAAPVVQKRFVNKDPINLRTRTIPYSEIKGFQQTTRPFGQQPILDAAAQAFKEPMFFEAQSLFGPEEVLEAKYVKKRVTTREYIAHYSKIPSYHKIGEESGVVWIAWLQAVHEIDVAKMDYCTEDEVRQLTAN